MTYECPYCPNVFDPIDLAFQADETDVDLDTIRMQFAVLGCRALGAECQDWDTDWSNDDDIIGIEVLRYA